MNAATGTLSSSLAPPRPPGWVRLAFVTFLGAFGARVAVLIVAWATTLQRMLPDGVLTDDALWWPWQVTSPWALAADAGLTLLVAVPAAWLVRVQLRPRELWTWPIVLAFAVAAPFRSQVAPLVLVPLAVRFLALRPSTGSPRRRPRAAVVVPLALGMAALLLATFSYQPFHPLRAGFPHRDDPLDPFGIESRVLPSRTLAFALRNEGSGTITLRSARAVGRNAVLAVVRDDGSIVGRTIRRGDVLFGSIAIPRAVCRDARTRSTAVTVEALEVRMDAPGGTRTQRFDVGPSESLRCR